MRFDDVLDKEFGLLQDEWSEQDLTFGKDGQLTVIGYSGRLNKGKHRRYILKCSICSLDEELHGDGVFMDTEYHIISGRTPCGCSRTPKWTEDQYKILCRRASENLGNTFIGWDGDFKGCAKTKVVQSCPSHGEWKSGTINNLTSAHSNRGCPRCRIEALVAGAVEAHTKDDNVHIEDFLSTGKFPDGTKFTKLYDLLDSYGRATNWLVECPACETSAISNVSNLKRGGVSCECGTRDQTFCYINLIKDGDLPIALKFGITNHVSRRIYAQNRASIYSVVNLKLFKFPDSFSCKSAERVCRSELVCGIVPREEMPDGYTETTSLSNIDKIIEVYKQYGGVEQLEQMG